MHELIWLAPALMAEEHKGLIVAPFEAETDLRAHPILCRTRIVPHHRVRIGVDHFEPVLAKLERSACGGVPVCLGGPPVPDAFDGRKGFENARRLSSDADAVKNVGHFKSPF